MKKLIRLFGVCLILFGMIGVAGATTINYLYNTSGNEFISVYQGTPGFTTENFNEGTLGSLTGLSNWTWSGNGQVVNGSTLTSSAPFGVSARDASNYVSVPLTLIPAQSVTVTNLGPGPYNYFGIWWGSVDTFNTLTFLSGATTVASYTGSDLPSPAQANGDQTSPLTNLYVNFEGLPSFDSFMITSTNYSFEADNITIGNIVPIVPEPATMLLLGSGLLGIGVYARRRFLK